MEEIKAYKTTDGLIFEDKEKAENHQSRINCQFSLRRLLARVWEDEISIDEVVDFLIDRRKEVVEILQEKEA